LDATAIFVLKVAFAPSESRTVQLMARRTELERDANVGQIY